MAAPVAPAIIVLVVPAAALLATAPPAPEPRWRPPPGSLIRDIVARHYGITRAEIQGGSHRAVYVLPRHVAMYLCVRLGGLSLPLTGRLFGNRDHTTVLHAVKRITDRSAESAALAAEVKTLWERCEAA